MTRQEKLKQALSAVDTRTETELENELAEKIMIDSFKWFLVVVEILIIAYFILQIF